MFNSASDTCCLNFPIELHTGYYRIGVYALDSAKSSGFDGKSYPTDYNDGSLREACVMAGFTTVDLRQDETINVYLSTNNLNQDGKVLLNFYTNGWTLDTAKFDVVCYIKNKAGVRVGPEPASLNAVTNVPPAAGAIHLYNASLVAGTYTLCVDYTNKEDSTLVYSWTDTLLVLSNQTIDKTIALIDIIQHEPDAPSGFKASYKDYDPTGNWCYVNFTWQDNSNNERGFEIDLLAVYPTDDDSLITSDMAASWNAVNQDYNAVTGAFTAWDGAPLTQKFDDVPGLCVDGSLGKNRNSATFLLNRNYRYLARICAVGNNRSGKSDYCYLDLSAGGTGKSGYWPFDTSARYIKVGD